MRAHCIANCMHTEVLNYCSRQAALKTKQHVELNALASPRLASQPTSQPASYSTHLTEPTTRSRLGSSPGQGESTVTVFRSCSSFTTYTKPATLPGER
mgnify:CR=1 FL=1